MKATTIEYIREHSKSGVWTGKTINGVPVIRYQGKEQNVKPFLTQLGIKLNNADKYSEREENAGMGESKSGGDTSDTGNGISQSQE
jgi:hypothetical protein